MELNLTDLAGVISTILIGVGAAIVVTTDLPFVVKVILLQTIILAMYGIWRLGDNDRKKLILKTDVK